MPRNFALIVDAPTDRKMKKTGIDLKCSSRKRIFIFNHWVLQNTTQELTIRKEMKQVSALFENLRARATSIDTPLKRICGCAGKANHFGNAKPHRGKNDSCRKTKTH
jgi:hypothetical protein